MHWKHSIGSCGCELLRRLIKVDDGLNKDGTRSKIRILPVDVPSLDDLEFPHTTKVKRPRKQKNPPNNVIIQASSDTETDLDDSDEITAVQPSQQTQATVETLAVTAGQLAPTPESRLRTSQQQAQKPEAIQKTRKTT